MPASTIICPHCFTALQDRGNGVQGGRVRCPKCGKTFLAPRMRSSPSQRAEESNSGIILLLAIGLLVLLAGAAGGLYLVFNAAKPEDRIQVDASGTKEKTSAKEVLDSVPPGGNSPPAPAPINNPPPEPVKPVEDYKPKPIETPPNPAPTPPVKDTKKDETPPPPPPPVNPFPNPNPPSNPPPSKDPEPGKLAPGQLSPENQTKVNDAIELGIKYLKSKQKADGSWEGTWPLGITALPALTLLESGVPPNDPSIQKAAAFVRQFTSDPEKSQYTYELSIAILFLDRLGDKRDSGLIQYLAMLLIATQKTDAGWSYYCTKLNVKSAGDLLSYLKETRPVPCTLSDGKPTPVNLNGKDPLPKEPVEAIFKPFNVNLLSPALRNLSVVQVTPAAKEQRDKVRFAQGFMPTDNSNTQFAIMALWVARKYGIPMDKTMALVDQRFLSSQNPDGGWGYYYHETKSTNTMTCAGLIGLAMGQVANKESLGPAWILSSAKNAKGDPAIQKGLELLGRHIGDAPADWKKRVNQENIYFVWSVERVAVLFNLKTIGGKDWYSWAAQMLVTNQQADGSWLDGQFTGETPVINTCLALLTLKRANLVPDLTDNLKDYIPIRDPNNK